MKRNVNLNEPLFGEQAAAMFLYLIEGEHNSRNYSHEYRHAFGYFFDPLIHKWVAFDNRMNSLFVEVCDTDTEARQLLNDGADLLAA